MDSRLNQAKLNSFPLAGGGGWVMLIGSAGIASSVVFGSGGKVDLELTGTAGLASSVAFGATGKLLQGLHGYAGIPTSVAFGVSGAVLHATDRNITVFIQGVDRTDWVGIPIRRSVQVGAAGGTLTFPINNHGRADYRPEKFDEVIVYVGTYRFFCGIVNTYDDEATSGTSGLYILTVNCISYGAMLNFRYVARHYELYNGALLGIIMYDLVTRYLADLGITWGGQGTGWTQTDAIPPITFNWITFTAVCQQFAAMFNLDFYVDVYKVLRMFSHLNGLNPAPFEIATNNGLWKRMLVTRGGGYANRVGVRNSQDLGSIWTDEYNGDSSQTVFPVSTALTAKPAIFVNGTAQRVTDAGQYAQPWDWYWLSLSVAQNPASAPLGSGDTVQIKYPSPISHVDWSEDTDEIAAHGKFEYLEEVKDIQTSDQLATIRAGLLARKVADITAITLETDELGLEPGQVLTVNTARPLVDDTFLIEQVDSEEQGLGGANPRASKTAAVKGFFSHVVRASNAQLQRRNSGVALAQRLLDQANQARDRITYSIVFTLAETVAGFTNPGLVVGTPDCPARRAPKSGIARSCSLFFQSSTSVLTDTDCVVDLKKNGVSIFPAGDAAKMVWPAGATAAQINFIFVSDPLDVTEGDLFLPTIIAADSKAKDGTLELVVQG